MKSMVKETKAQYSGLLSSIKIGNTETSSHYTKNVSTIRNSTPINKEVRAFKVRNIYRELTKNSSSNKGWINVNELMKSLNYTGEIDDFVESYKLQQHKHNPDLVRISNISRFEILDDIYFDSQKKSYPYNLVVLKKMSLDEPWEDDNKINGLLDNYLCYTYARIKEEGKISLSEDGLHGCWNTGLVNNRYSPIYCYMTRKKPEVRWVFQGFCIDGEDLGKIMVSNIKDLPSRALYFTNGNILFEPDIENLSVDYDHIITEHPSRLPLDWVKRAIGDRAVRLEEENDYEYDLRVGKLIKGDALDDLQTRLKKAIDISLMRCQWNYKTAIPYYDPNSTNIENNIGWFLPLCIQSKNENPKDKAKLIPFAALVVTKERSGRYQGQTIYKLSWAYRCARLVCRPDSDWLSPSCSTKYDNKNVDCEPL